MISHIEVEKVIHYHWWVAMFTVAFRAVARGIQAMSFQKYFPFPMKRTTGIKAVHWIHMNVMLIALRVPLIQQPCWKAEISRKVRAVQVISLHLQRQKPSLFPRKCPARMRTTMQTLVMKVLTTGHRNLSWRQLVQPRSEGALFYLPSGKSHFFATL